MGDSSIVLDFFGLFLSGKLEVPCLTITVLLFEVATALGVLAVFIGDSVSFSGSLAVGVTTSRKDSFF